MKRLITAFVVAAMCATGGAAFAQTAKSKPATKTEQTKKASGKEAATTPATVTAVCKDGTTYTGKTRKGACSRHGGVKSWEKGKEKNKS